jgi:glycosyltransferase involved in cell wall biosynthesis
VILIDALHINKGGGAVLLRYLIERVLAHPEAKQFFFLLDPRFEKPSQLSSQYVVIPNKQRERKKFFAAHWHEYSKVFCFANTPPPIKLSVPVYTYSHNQKLFEAAKRPTKKMHWGPFVKYLYIVRYNRNTDYYIVQTEHMVRWIVALKLKKERQCMLLPFYDANRFSGAHTPFDQRPADEFVYISTPSPQKNHGALLDAWELLHTQGHHPLLHVTIDDTAPGLLQRVGQMTAKGIKIINHKFLDPRELYFTRRYLIYPSIMESFGLPLIEAAESGMKVLASDLPYVKDVVIPSISFNPYVPQSIADAVVEAHAADLPFPEITTSDKVEELISILLGESTSVG